MAKKNIEVILGTMADQTFGQMAMVGLGGITTELFRDVIYRPAPVSEAEPDVGHAQSGAVAEWIPWRCLGRRRHYPQLIADISVLAAQHALDIGKIEL